MRENVEVSGKGTGSGTPFLKAFLTVMDPDELLLGSSTSGRERFVLVLVVLAGRGYGRCRVRSVLRSLDEQRRLYGLGRTKEQCRRAGVPVGYACPDEDVVTWCPPEDSKHVRGDAVDVDLSMYDEFPWSACHQAAVLAGVRWGGDWPQKDGGHFEV